MSQSSEPAIVCYVLEKAWSDWHQLLLRYWNEIGRLTENYFKKYELETHWWSLFFRIGGAAGILAIGGLLSVTAALIQVVVISVIALLRLTLTASFWALEWLWRFRWKVFNICPACSHSSTLPAFICDNCNAIHRELVPNRYGLFTHRCQCGARLRSSMFSGRGRHAACCPIPDCCHPITHFGHTPVLIALGGGRSNGKTNLLYRSLASLTRVQASLLGWNLEWHEQDGERFEALENQYLADAVRSTPNELPTAYRLRLRTPKRSVDRIVQIYDPGGEAFQEQESLNAHSYYARVAGAVFVIDPFSLPSVVTALGETPDSLADVRPAEENAAACFERLVETLDTKGQATGTRRTDTVLAIVISKLDARNLLAKRCLLSLNLSDHEAGRAFLIHHGLGGLVSQADSYFRDVRIFMSGNFSTSAEENAARDAAAPLLWIIDKAETTLATRIKG